METLTTTLEIEIGKEYTKVCDIPGMTYRPSRMIVGRVVPGTIEWDEGYRFYDNTGGIRFPDGRYHPKSEDSIIDREGIRETLQEDRDIEIAAGRDWKTFRVDRHQLDELNLDFKIRLGGVYVDRMGLLHLINVSAMYRGQTIYPQGHDAYYTEEGRYVHKSKRKDLRSMRDLICVYAPDS